MSNEQTEGLDDLFKRLLPHPAPNGEGPAPPGSDDYYFESYDNFGIHQDMIKDSVRTDAYMKAICGNPQLFKDKVVLDVGCGTGILSLFAAEAGAKKVYSVDQSRIVEQAKKIVALNGKEDVITVIDGKVEDIEIPEGGVDIIISEWMGYFLLYESMLDSVIAARDKWLNPGGIIFPDRASLYMCGIEDERQREISIYFWEDIYGFDMSCICPLVEAEPMVEIVSHDQIITDSTRFKTINIETATVEDLAFASEFAIKATQTNNLSALACWFDVEFTHGEKTVCLPTGPMTQSTHWKQASLFLPEAILLEEGDVFEGTLVCRPSAANRRGLDIGLEFGVRNGMRQSHSQYRM